MKKLIAIVAALTISTLLCAQEHPKEHPTSSSSPAEEHPKAKSSAEHPAGHEHPVGSKGWNKHMRKEYTQAVENHVKEKSTDGAFTIKDDKLDKEWRLKLAGVHKKRIAHLGGTSFFACADFKSVETGSKDKLDLDFYATKTGNNWKIDKVLIHKVNDKPRYTYNDKNEMVPMLN